MDVSTKSLKYVTSYKWDVEDGAGVSHDRRHIAFLLNENGVSTLHVLDIGSGKELRMPTLPAGVITYAGTRTIEIWAFNSTRRSRLLMSIRSTFKAASWNAGPRARLAAFHRRVLSSQSWSPGRVSMAARFPDGSTSRGRSPPLASIRSRS